MTAPILQVRDLSVRFGATHAVRGVSFHVDKGEIGCACRRKRVGQVRHRVCRR